MNKSGVSSSATCKQIEIFVFLMIAIDIPNEILRKKYNKNLIFKFVLHDLGLGFENPNIMLTFVVMKKLIITLFLTCLTLTGQSQTKWALVVGIGPYPQESGWNAIHGDNDIELVCSFLSEIGANHQHIKVLKNEIATKQNIVSAFQWLSKHVAQNDWVYIHLSGHGQRITDLDGDEDDCWDEAFIPYDAQKKYSSVYHGENHLIDDELNEWLTDLRNKIGKSGTLCIVLDACHSGDGTRYEDKESDGTPEEYRRGTNDCFIIPAPTPLERGNRRPIDWLCLSACKSYESNYEYKINDQYFGRLSYAISCVARPQMQTDELIEALNTQYELMPLARNRIQTLSVDVPPCYLETPFVK